MSGSEREPAVIGVQEVARYLRLNHSEISRMLHAGELDEWTTARDYWRISAFACDRWIA